MIQTVLGGIEKEMLGKVYMHEHVYADLSGVRKEEDSILTNVDEIETELKMAVDLGIDTFVDVSCIGMGRDVLKLQTISKNLSAHVVCATGFYLPSYYPDYVYEKDEKYLAEIFIKEITQGIDDTGVFPGIIGEIATGKNDFTKENVKVFKAAAQAHKQTGLPITTHASAGTLSWEQAQLLIKEGVDPEKIIIGHQDLCEDREALVNVLKLGVAIGFDTIGKNAYLPNDLRVDNLIYLLDKGYEGQIILSQDISRKSYYASKGGVGYGYLVKKFLPALREKGVSAEAIDAMLTRNPAKILDVGTQQSMQKELFGLRLKVLVDNGVVSPRAGILTQKYIRILREKYILDSEHANYNMFETHLSVCMNRILNKQPIEEFPPGIEDEILGTWFCNAGLEALARLSQEENIEFSSVEGEFLAMHLGVLLKEA